MGKDKAPEAQQFPPGEEDIQKRIEGFNTELLPLLGKYELGLAAQARFSQDGRVVADPIIVSVRKQKDAPAEPASDAGLSKAD